MHQIIQGSPEHTRHMAKLYVAAFPASVKRFFAKKPRQKLLELLELTFLTVFYWGGEAVLVKDEAGLITGYCLYLNPTGLASRRRWLKVLGMLRQMVGKVSLAEMKELLRNQMLITRSTKSTKKTPLPRSQARILSIAIDPSCHGQGLGTLLLNSTLKELEHHRVGLNVRVDNPPARRLYARAGFKEYGTTRDLSGDWIVLSKDPHVEAKKR